jgi:hypothetical protein
VDPASYRSAVTVQYTFDGVVNEYLRRAVGIKGANDVYREQVPSAFWSVRYFRNLQKEEYFVVLLPDGGEHSVHHTLAETTAGANLRKEDAQALAAAYLSSRKGFNLAEWKVIQAQSNKLPARTDHSFVWEQTKSLIPSASLPPGDTEGAHVRASVDVLGDEVSDYRIRVHVPEEWERAQERTTLGNTAQFIGQMAALAAFVISVLVVFFRSLRQASSNVVEWRKLSRGLFVVLIAAVASLVTSAPQYLSTYQTDKPFGLFAASMLIGLTLFSMLLYSLAVLLLGLGMIFMDRAGTDGHPISETLRWRGMPSLYYRDVLWIGVCGSVVLAALPRVANLVGAHWSVARYEIASNVPLGLGATWPAVSAVASAVLRGYLLAGVLAVVLGFVACYLRGPVLQALLLLMAAVLMAPHWGSAGDFAQGALLGVLELAVLWWGAKLARFNLLGYVLVVLLLSLAAGAQDLLQQPNAFFRANGWALVAAIVVLLCWFAGGWLRRAGGEASEARA